MLNNIVTRKVHFADNKSKMNGSIALRVTKSSAIGKSMHPVMNVASIRLTRGIGISLSFTRRTVGTRKRGFHALRIKAMVRFDALTTVREYMPSKRKRNRFFLRRKAENRKGLMIVKSISVSTVLNSLNRNIVHKMNKFGMKRRSDRHR